MAKREARFWCIGGIDDAPDRFVEPYAAAMEAVVAVVLRHVILAAVEHERRATNSIRKAPDQRAQVGVLLQVFRERREREDDIVANTLAVRYFDPDDRPAVGDDLHAQPSFTSQGVEIDRRAVRRHSVRSHKHGSVSRLHRTPQVQH
jgi:hypothetical protein